MGKGNIRNSICSCGSGKKYKKCCLEKDERRAKLKQRVMTISRRDFISKPYKQCPKCLKDDSFGVFTPIGKSTTYIRECIGCSHRQGFALPKITKRVIYLDQFVISNLVKLLDKDHPSHTKVKADPFWETLFIKLEAASKSQAIICPDSFYHKDESLIGSIDFRLMKRLYEHFSNGKTLQPSAVIEKNNILKHFENWLDGNKTHFDFDPQIISFGEDLHTWSIGLRVTVGGGAYPGQLESLLESNNRTKQQFEEIWKRWQTEKDVSFIDRVKEETLGLGKGLVEVTRRYEERKKIAIERAASGEHFDLDIDDVLPPISNDIFEGLLRIARKKGISENEIGLLIFRYFNDVDLLLEIPQIKISSVMLAGLAHRASNGKKEAPKSSADVQFISSYLPYCDALFVDKESAHLLKEFPKKTPEYLRLKEFPGKVFSLTNKQEFLDYLDEIINDIPKNQIEILKDINGEDYDKPFWNIIEYEKRDRKD